MIDHHKFVELTEREVVVEQLDYYAAEIKRLTADKAAISKTAAGYLRELQRQRRVNVKLCQLLKAERMLDLTECYHFKPRPPHGPLL